MTQLPITMQASEQPSPDSYGLVWLGSRERCPRPHLVEQHAPGPGILSEHGRGQAFSAPGLEHNGLLDRFEMGKPDFEHGGGAVPRRDPHRCGSFAAHESLTGRQVPPFKHRANKARRIRVPV